MHLTFSDEAADMFDDLHGQLAVASYFIVYRFFHAE